jgi:hypothetical protein
MGVARSATENARIWQLKTRNIHMGIGSKIDADERRKLIAEAAYFRAQRRGFELGHADEDWLAAETEVDAHLARLERERLLAKLDEGLAAATAKLAQWKRRAGDVAAEARSEWQQDVEKLGKLRESLTAKLETLREQGERAGERARQQAEAVSSEIAEIVSRVGVRRRH